MRSTTFRCREMEQRRAIRVTGTVQGVGFRPFVHGLAVRYGLSGFVRNRAGEVLIEAQGPSDRLDSFLRELIDRPPPLARIDSISWIALPPQLDSAFTIQTSDNVSGGQTFIAPDVATCQDCLRELRNPEDRRFQYPFLNCTNCGPRLTIVTGSPYDRSRTTMSRFALCAACEAEYNDPSNRRFHAQPTACPVCGPQLQLLDNWGATITSHDPLGTFADALLAGQIGAIKGLGGFHLACNALDPSVVTRLRRRKERDEKPFAVMTADVQSTQAICEMNECEQRLLTSGRRPIVLLRRRSLPLPGQAPAGGNVGQTQGTWLAEAIAPANPYLGVMLPYTPLHYLLMERVGGVPLVMTSGNRADEPIAHDQDDAMQRLGHIADLLLTHDRPISVRCDDSVTRVIDKVELPVRRSRGDAPQPVTLPLPCRQPMLSLGGQLKATFALARGRHAFLSHHMGDLEEFETYQSYRRDIRRYEQLLQIHPEVVVHDLHPDYQSTRYAIERTSPTGSMPPEQPGAVSTPLQDGVPLRHAVQHHHAHMASCMAEHGLDQPAIGVIFDGSGYGADGAIWGGEFLVGDYADYRRVAQLRYVRLPGAELAIRQPWRMAVSYLMDAGCNPQRLASRVSGETIRTVEQMIHRQINSPLTSSMGRLFDAISSLLAIRDRVSYEGQAAIELEWQATDVAVDYAYPFDILPPADDHEVPCHTIDARPIIRAIVEDLRHGTDSSKIARRFHCTIVEMICQMCRITHESTGIDTIVLSGGVFMNTLLIAEAVRRLAEMGFAVYRHQLVPCNDAGLSLGQIAVAAAQLFSPTQ